MCSILKCKCETVNLTRQEISLVGMKHTHTHTHIHVYRLVNGCHQVGSFNFIGIGYSGSLTAVAFVRAVVAVSDVVTAFK